MALTSFPGPLLKCGGGDFLQGGGLPLRILVLADCTRVGLQLLHELQRLSGHHRCVLEVEMKVEVDGDVKEGEGYGRRIDRIGGLLG